MRENRGALSIRQAAEAAGVSFMTFSRVENGSQPDLATLMRLCAWLGVAPEQFFVTPARRVGTTLDAVASHLATDPRLDREAAQRIVAMVRDMYAVLAHESVSAAPVACHLRAATVLRPGVPERLASVLNEMHDRLLERDGAR